MARLCRSTPTGACPLRPLRGAPLRRSSVGHKEFRATAGADLTTDYCGDWNPSGVFVGVGQAGAVQGGSVGSGVVWTGVAVLNGLRVGVASTSGVSVGSTTGSGVFVGGIGAGVFVGGGVPVGSGVADGVRFGVAVSGGATPGVSVVTAVGVRVARSPMEEPSPSPPLKAFAISAPPAKAKMQQADDAADEPHDLRPIPAVAAGAGGRAVAIVATAAYLPRTRLRRTGWAGECRLSAACRRGRERRDR